MTIYLLKLKDASTFAFKLLPMFVFALFFLFFYIMVLLKRNKAGLSKSKYFILFIFVVFIVFVMIPDIGESIACYKIYRDYKTASISYYEGFIEDTYATNSLRNTYVIINGYKFLASRSYVKGLEDDIGLYCEIAFGTNSRYIVDYRIIED